MPSLIASPALLMRASGKRTSSLDKATNKKF
jgi:hypothetical protein